MSDTGPRHRRTQQERDAAMVALRVSADENGGAPNWLSVSKALDIDRKTLKAWWSRRDAVAGPRRKRRTVDEHRRGMEELEASAAGNGGVPVWSAVSARLGVSRDTLQSWWSKRRATIADAPETTTPKVVVLPRPERETPGPHEQLSDPLGAVESVYWASRWAEVARDMDTCRESAPGSLGTLHRVQSEIYRNYLAARKAETKTGPRASGDVASALRKAVSAATPDHLRVIAEELRKRGAI